jgi:hypothetical protein
MRPNWSIATTRSASEADRQAGPAGKPAGLDRRLSREGAVRRRSAHIGCRRFSSKWPFLNGAARSRLWSMQVKDHCKEVASVN